MGRPVGVSKVRPLAVLLVTVLRAALCPGCPIDRLSDGPHIDTSHRSTVFETNSLPRDANTGGVDFRYMASVGNGHLATVVYSDTVYVNGLYNGMMGWSHRARIPSTQAIRTEATWASNCDISRTYRLDVKRAMFEEVAMDSMGSRIVQRTYAHQHFTRLLVTDILIERRSPLEKPLSVLVSNHPGNKSMDISWSEERDYPNQAWPSYEQNGTTLQAELNGTSLGEDEDTKVQQIYLFSTRLPRELTLRRGQAKGRWIFITSLDQDYSVARRAFQNGLDLIYSDPDYLYHSHIAAWEAKWSMGRIEVVGNSKLQKLIHGSLYYLMSFLPSSEPYLPANQFYGLSPGGLANGANWTDYQGHVFWDMETWMYPTILMFHPELAKEMLSYRIRGMEFAYERARSGGYSGLRYPWESARTGVEVTPDICVPCRENQQHVTGDIALAARQYLTATKDLEWLRDQQGYEFIRDMGVFWATRPSYNPEKDAFEINGVMPPDEKAIFVNNSVYTNVLAGKSIRFARYAACLNDLEYQDEINDTFISIADNIFIPFNSISRYHPEFEGYETYNNGSHTVKQADVILLGYPLMYEMAQDVRRNDLNIYENVTDEGGPAMTWGMFAIGWLELGDYNRAAELFKKSYSLYTREPFKVWTEAKAGIGAVNFLTGMGGFLQTLFFGYGGARLHVERLTFDPVLPPETEGMKFLDVNYLGSRFDLFIWEDRLQIIVKEAVKGQELILVINSTGSQYLMRKGRHFDMAREAFYLEGSDINECPLPEGSSCPVAVARSELTSVDPSSRPVTSRVEYIVLTHTGGGGCHTREGCLEKATAHMDRFNYLIGRDGSVYEGTGMMTATQTTDLGSSVITVAFLGDHKCKAPDTKMLAAVKRLIKCLIEKNELMLDYTVLTLEQGVASGQSEGVDDAIFCAIKDWKHWKAVKAMGALREPDCDWLCEEEIDYTVQSDGFTDLSKSPYIFETDKLPTVEGTSEIDVRYLPSLGNGHIATVPYTSFVYMNGLFNGLKGESHRASIPSPHNIMVAVVTPSTDAVKSSYRLDTKNGVFEERQRTPNVTVSIRRYTHQHYTQLLVTEVRVQRLVGTAGNISLDLTNSPPLDSPDISFTPAQQYYDKEKRPIANCFWRKGETLQPETMTGLPQEVYIYWNEVPLSAGFLAEGKDSATWIFIAAIDTDKNKAATVFQSGLWRIGDGSEVLFNRHATSWWQKWDSGRIEVKGNLQLSKLLESSQYYLLSSLPSTDPNHPNEQFYGLGVDDLARGRDGHVTWLQENLAFQPVLMFHPDVAKDILSYRVYTIGQMKNVEGMLFPWHSALTGTDVTPENSTCSSCSVSAKHVAGDIALTALQYIAITGDLKWLTKTGYNLILETSKYWVDQLTFDEQIGKYSIFNVTPPDLLTGNVNNSVYTNQLARLSIHLGRYAACLATRDYKRLVPDNWLKMADNIYLSEDVINSLNLGSDGLDVTSNLSMGQSKWSPDSLKDMYQLYVKQPFKLWKPSPVENGNVNSIPAMSGFLQSVLFGYGGVRMANAYILFDPNLPPNTTTLQFKGFHYLGNSLDIVITVDTVKITNRKSSDKQLYLVKIIQQKPELGAKLQKGHEVTINREPFIISSSSVTECPLPMGSSCICEVARSTWGGVEPVSPVGLVTPAVRVVVYQTGGERCMDIHSCSEKVKRLQTEQMRDIGIGDIAYNFLVGEDGRVYEGRGWDTLAHFPRGAALDTIAIGVLGDFTCDGPSDLAVAVLKEQIKCGIERGLIHWNYTLLGSRQLENIHDVATLEDRLLCQLMESRHWERFQHGGMFVKPKCTEECKRPFVPPEGRYKDTSQQATVFETDKLPTVDGSDLLDFDYMASVGNGHLSTVVYSPTVYVNGLYNGPTGWSHRARIPALNALRVNFTDVQEDRIHRRFALDVERAVFEERVVSPRVHVLQRTYAHQFYTRLLVTEIRVQRQPGARGKVTLSLLSTPGGPSKDITFGDLENVTDSLIEKCDCVSQHGRTNEAETNNTALADVFLYWNRRPETLTLSAEVESDVWIFVTAIDQSRQVAEESMQAAVWRIREGPDSLYDRHIEAWKKRWNRGRIEVDGDLYLSKRIHGAFYYLLSFLPAFEPYITPNQFYGLSPGGLANGANWTDYQGHVFWDMETWMYPTILMFHPELAKEMLSYRIHGMKYAEQRAREGNFSGLRFPWESAYTGYEQTPDICVPCRENQLHITGDIGLAARQYLTMTRDLRWLQQEKGFELIRGMADFWQSRPTWNSTKMAYDINGVMPPDEHAQSINNSVYTNVGAKLSIHYARYAACLSGMNATAAVPDNWLEVADKLHLPFNKRRQYHPEFEGYEQWTDERGVKQADAILLGYPQMWPMSPEVRRNDLEVYEKVTNPLGPAMTWGMYAIGWLELGDEDRARELFWRSYALYVREPFKIWTEVKTGLGAVNFITGMGGFLQTVFFGYGGARIHVENLSFDPRVPPGTNALRFIGIDYLENSFDMEITEERVQILPTKISSEYPLIIEMKESRAQYSLQKGKELLLSRKPFTLRTSVWTDCPVPEGSSCPMVTERQSWDSEGAHDTMEASSASWTHLSRPQPTKTVVLHHSAMAHCFNFGDCRKQARLLKEHQMSDRPRGLGMADVSYGFILGEDGSVFEGRGWDAPFPVSLDHLNNSIGIVLLGDFSCSEPNGRVLEALQRLIKCGVERKKIAADYKLVTLDDVHKTEVRADRLTCTVKQWPHWHATEGRASPDCDAPCDPTAPRSMEGVTKDTSPLSTVFQTHSLPTKDGSEEIDFRYMASVGNGHLATIVYSDTVYVNGLYNGPTGWSHRARIPSSNAIRLHVTDTPAHLHQRVFSLDVEKGVFEESISTAELRIIQRTYAHQYYNRLLVTEITVTRLSDGNDVFITVDNNRGNDSIDIQFKPKEDYKRPEICPDGCYLMDGETIIPETETSPRHSVTVVWKRVPTQLTLLAGERTAHWVFAMAMDQNRIKAEQTFDDALRQWNSNPDYLYNLHVKAWEEKWKKGRIEVDGNTRLSKLIYGSFYYLLSSLPSKNTFVPNNQFYGLSPGGLANGANWTDYQGHVFWDMETWMYPTILMFHPELAKEMLSYRLYSMEPSQKRAESGGYSGLRYPWEAAFTGGEVTPDICVPCRENQQHITGDIAFAARQYLTATRDLQWLKSEKGYEFIKGMAEFWKTRPEWNANTGFYDINGVMPPDEHQISINNSVYTNIGAKLSINFARYAACLAGRNPTREIGDDWLEVANKIFVPFNMEHQYHPEFEGYGNVTGEKKIVKQADVILTGFPQMWPMPTNVRRNDLEMYEKVTHPLGPAMTWGMFAIGWLEFGDEERALDMFHRSYSLYTREPFKIWTEARSGIGAVNFITGMGGFLQAVLFGYGGARLHTESLKFDPRLIPGTSALRFVGLDYLGNSLDVEIGAETVTVVCQAETDQHRLVLDTKRSGVRYHLTKDMAVSFPREAFTIRTVEITDCPLPEVGSCPEVVWRDSSAPQVVNGQSLFSTVVVHQTGGEQCHDQTHCLRRVSQLQGVEYDFLIGGDGRVYETSRWLMTARGPEDRTLRLAFIGDFTCAAPNELAIATSKRLIKCKVEMGMLNYDYTLLTMRQTRAPDCRQPFCPADRLDCELIKWNAWSEDQVGGTLQWPDCHGSCFVPDNSTLPEHQQYVDISDEPTKFQTDRLPIDPGTGDIDYSYMASVSNGHLATVVFSDTIYVNGLYSGDMGWSHRARIPSPNAVRVKEVLGERADRLNRLYTLDVEKAVFEETVDTPNVMIHNRIYAHQIYTRVLITQISITRKAAAKGSFTLVFSSNQGNASKDIAIVDEKNYNDNDEVIFKHGQTISPEINGRDTSDVYIIHSQAPGDLKLEENDDKKTIFIITSIGLDQAVTSKNFDEVWRLMSEEPDQILSSHVSAWEQRWKGGHIEIEGNLQLSKLVYGCFYYLLSFLPSNQPFTDNLPFNGLSPGGLANGANWTDYQGHVFWDMETWMYPTILMFHPELAKEMLSYRIRGMEFAYERAQSGGFEGLRFPWESAQTGTEVTPDICVPCRENQLHITGDIAMAAKQYMSVTNDLQWLKAEKGYDLIKDIAKFWKTRPTWNEQKGEYEIKGVMPPDEHAQNVSNSVYTNVQARLSIYFARYMACVNGLDAKQEVGADWLNVANKLHIPYDETRLFHPEYEGYEEGLDIRGVKQADAILLGFPLMYKMSETVRRNDLLHYEKVTNAFGPAMTWGMFAIGWLELGDVDKAAELFMKSHALYMREPFKIWTEARSGIGAVNFITGMGGFLQSVYFGYAGVRIYNEHLTFNPRLPPLSSGLKLVAMNYLGNTLDIVIRHSIVSITLTHSTTKDPLFVRIHSTGAVFDLYLDVEVTIPQTPFTLASYHVSDCPYPQDPVCPPVVSHREWSSSVQEGGDSLVHPVSYVIVYQTGENCYSKAACVREANRHQSANGGVRYNFLVGEDGRIYEGRGWNTARDHSENFNSRSIAIGLMGDFTNSGPNNRGMAALKLLIKCGMEIGKVNETYSLLGEKQIRESSCKTCPGDKLLCHLMASQRWVNYQEGGDFISPCCQSSCDSTINPSTRRPNPTTTPTSSATSISSQSYLYTLTLIIISAIIRTS